MQGGMRPWRGRERSIGVVRRPPVHGLLAAALTALALLPATASGQLLAPAPGASEPTAGEATG
ncbi:MAG: hypothetical protein JWO90_3257, partial [Solirubrobacterales bacterium]|nr:hypothetical protein [Solirubrobacterales bacterium]